MIELTLAEIASIVAGRLGGGADPGAVVDSSVEFDSRLVTAGGLFLAVPGDHQDGHDFAAAAIKAGATAVMGTRPLEVPNIEVGDALTALADLAREVLRRLPQVTVIGVTGSSGKTSTKDLLAQLLPIAGPTVAPPGSFNNELGHPYTVLRADHTTRFLVTETSARGIGHIRYLTEIAPPRIGVVLNVGSAHLGEFGSVAAIAQAKGELVEALPAAADGGVAVLNAADAAVAAMAARTRARVVTFGAHGDVQAGDVRLDELGRARFELRAPRGSADVALRLVGSHHVGNALAAAAVAFECGLTVDVVAAALSKAEPLSRWRMQLTERADGTVVVNDTYNANPESMRAALVTLAAIGAARPSGRTWAVLGEMAELGPASDTAHHELGRHVAQLGIDRLIAVGDRARPIIDGATLEGWTAEPPEWVPDVAAATELLAAGVRPGDAVLVKASRAAGLERVALALTDDHETSGEDQA